MNKLQARLRRAFRNLGLAGERKAHLKITLTSRVLPRKHKECRGHPTTAATATATATATSTATATTATAAATDF